MFHISVVQDLHQASSNQIVNLNKRIKNYVVQKCSDFYKSLTVKHIRPFLGSFRSSIVRNSLFLNS